MSKTAFCCCGETQQMSWGHVILIVDEIDDGGYALGQRPGLIEDDCVDQRPANYVLRKMPKTINDRLNQTAMLASMTHAAKAGIIAKSGRHMERLAD